MAEGLAQVAEYLQSWGPELNPPVLQKKKSVILGDP
jgi:hypothetical protein